MKPDYTAFKFWIDLMVLAIVALNWAYTIWSNREKVTNKRFITLESQVHEMVRVPDLVKIKEARDMELAGIKRVTDNICGSCAKHTSMEQRLDGHSDRLGQHKELIVKIETEFQSLPKIKDVTEVHKRVDAVSAQLGALQSDISKVVGELPGIRHITEMLNEYLLTKEKK